MKLFVSLTYMCKVNVQLSLSLTLDRGYMEVRMVIWVSCVIEFPSISFIRTGG